MAESTVSNERLAFFQIVKIRNDGETQKLPFHRCSWRWKRGNKGCSGIKDVSLSLLQVLELNTSHFEIIYTYLYMRDYIKLRNCTLCEIWWYVHDYYKFGFNVFQCFKLKWILFFTRTLRLFCGLDKRLINISHVNIEEESSKGSTQGTTRGSNDKDRVNSPSRSVGRWEQRATSLNIRTCLTLTLYADVYFVQAIFYTCPSIIIIICQ